MIYLRRILWALTRSRARTDPGQRDPRLQGRTYAIPFGRVWDAALEVCREWKRWSVTRADDQEGVLEAEATTPIFRFVDDVRVEIGLDPNGQTRVDLVSASRVGKADLGTNARRIGRFVKKLDRKLEASPSQVLEGRAELRWEEA